MSQIIGIDLGTSTSEAACFENGRAKIILNREGKGITPSVIGLDENGEFLIGDRAAERYLLYPEKTAIEVKRKMGIDEGIELGGKVFSAPELSAKILAYLKECAENYLKEPVERAVITVPAYFNNRQRQETLDAGKMAGLKVERIINEPTAAALCYGIEHMEDESHILIFDLGGGTFDVTLLEMFDGVLEVKASSGDNKLGGKDFDEAIIEYLLGCCENQYQTDLRQDVYAMVKLKEEAVRCKIALSSQESYEVLLPMISSKDGKPISIQEVITVPLFEQLIQELVERTRKPVRMVLQDSGIEASELDLILLVGGSTRVPYVKRYVQELLGQAPKEMVDPDLAVVMGAGIQAGMLDEAIDAETGLMLTDVAPYPLGVRVTRGNDLYLDTDYMDVLISRNVTIPVTRRKRYTTLVDGQRETRIEIYQGEQEKATSNYFLGKFLLEGIPAAPAGKEKVDVEFSYDLNGILEVKAAIVSTGRQAGITIDTAGREETKADSSEWKKAPLAKKFRSTIRKAEKLEASGEIMEDGEQEELSEMIEELKLALLREESEKLLERMEEELLDFLVYYEE
ncbi:MAG: Hsp70 family protein [Lachnospiraceae bacterium]|nr:Hsp70 family protein [Lachnospiraceae bacterium]